MQQAQTTKSFNPPENPGASAKDILVLRRGDFRSFVLALGALEALRTWHLRARITLVATPGVEPFAKLCPFVDDVVVDLDHDDKTRRAAALTALRRQSFDMVYDLDGTVESETLLRGLKRRFGPAPVASGPTASATFSPASKPGSVNEIQRLTGQLILAGVEFTKLPSPNLAWVRHKLGNPPRLTPEYFGIAGRFALICVSSEAQGEERYWPQPAVASLCKTLAGAGITPVLIGDREAGSLAQSVEMSVRDAKNLVARADHAQTVALAGAADVVIGVDSAALQIAGIVGTPCLLVTDTKTARSAIDTPYSAQFITVHAMKVADVQSSTLWRMLTSWEQARIAKPLEESPSNRHIGA